MKLSYFEYTVRADNNQEQSIILGMADEASKREIWQEKDKCPTTCTKHTVNYQLHGHCKKLIIILLSYMCELMEWK